MSKTIEIDGTKIGDGYPCYIIAEVGINHNGDVGIARELIDIARDAGCNAVKFQIRDVDKLFTSEKMAEYKESPWGTTYGEYVSGREFDDAEMSSLVYYCISSETNLDWGASYWGCVPSDDYPTPDFIKIPSARIIELNEIIDLSQWEVPVIISTGASNYEQITAAYRTARNHNKEVALLQCNATYPAKNNELDLRVIGSYKNDFDCVAGYSGHENGTAISLCAVALGANIIERHITLDRTMWGTDHAASLEPNGLRRLVRDIRNLESALGDGIKKIYPSETEKMKTLRG